MIVGFHIIFGAYGFWLPNDPRGSWSKTVRSWELFRYGEAKKTTAKHSLAHLPHDHNLRLEAKTALKYPAVKFTGLQARAIARGFSESCTRAAVPVWACAILPDHVHIVTGSLHIAANQLAIQLKGAATKQLLEEGIHPLTEFCEENARPPKCFARGQWTVFLNESHISNAIRYVENNPLKEGKRLQHWKFVTQFEDH